MFHFYSWLFFRKMIDVIYEIKMDGPPQTKYLYIQICTVKVDNWLLFKDQCFTIKVIIKCHYSNNISMILHSLCMHFAVFIHFAIVVFISLLLFVM